MRSGLRKAVQPVERTLQSYAVNLHNTAGLAGVLRQARGERVEVSFLQPTPGQPATLSGSVIGVEVQKVPGMGKLSLFTDPEGRMMGLWKAKRA